MLGARAIGKTGQPRGELHRAYQRVFRESLIQLRELLELGKLGTERALPGLAHGEEFSRQRPFLYVGARTFCRRENPAFERHAGFILRIEDRIARDENRVLTSTESLALLARRAFEHVKRLVRREPNQRRDALRIDDDLCRATAQQLRSRIRGTLIDGGLPAGTACRGIRDEARR